MGPLALFVYLQVLDFLTTILFLKMGLRETGLIARLLVHWNPLVGVMLVKVAAVLVAVIAVRYNKARVMRLANVGYCGVVTWNLVCMIMARAA
jgi:hypothetical protein